MPIQHSGDASWRSGSSSTSEQPPSAASSPAGSAPPRMPGRRLWVGAAACALAAVVAARVHTPPHPDDYLTASRSHRPIRHRHPTPARPLQDEAVVAGLKALILVLTTLGSWQHSARSAAGQQRRHRRTRRYQLRNPSPPGHGDRDLDPVRVASALRLKVVRYIGRGYRGSLRRSGGLGPHEWFGVVVPDLDPVADVLWCCRAKHEKTPSGGSATYRSSATQRSRSR